MKTIMVQEATDKQIVDYIFDNPEEWEIDYFCFFDQEYKYEVKRNNDDIDVTIYDVVFVEDGEEMCKDWCHSFTNDCGIEIDDDDEERYDGFHSSRQPDRPVDGVGLF